MSSLDTLLETLKVESHIFHNGQYAGEWAIDTSGSNLMTFHIVSRGTCVIATEGKSYKLDEGDAVFLPSDSQHCLSALPNSTFEVNKASSYPMTMELDEESTGLVCGFFYHQHPLFDNLLKQLPKLIIIKNKTDNCLASLLSLIMAESRGIDSHNSFLLNRLSESLFYILIKRHLGSDQRGVLAAMSHPKLEKCMETIHDSEDERLSVNNLAVASGMSRSAFAVLFKDIVGQTPNEYILQWKMSQAYSRLRDENTTTLAVALGAGYENESSFSKAFKRVLGITPGEVRKQRHQRTK